MSNNYSIRKKQTRWCC